jgi:hypothetical protein
MITCLNRMYLTPVRLPTRTYLKVNWTVKKRNVGPDSREIDDFHPIVPVWSLRMDVFDCSLALEPSHILYSESWLWKPWTMKSFVSFLSLLAVSLCKGIVPILIGLCRAMGRGYKGDPPLFCRLFPAPPPPALAPSAPTGTSVSSAFAGQRDDRRDSSRLMLGLNHGSTGGFSRFRPIIPRSLSQNFPPLDDMASSLTTCDSGADIRWVDENPFHVSFDNLHVLNFPMISFWLKRFGHQGFCQYGLWMFLVFEFWCLFLLFWLQVLSGRCSHDRVAIFLEVEFLVSVFA